MAITDYSVAEKVIESAIENGFVEKDEVPDEEAEYLEKATELYEMAIDARDNHDVDTDDVLGIIAIVDEAPAPKKGKPAAGKKAAKPKAKKPAPEPEEEEEDEEEEPEEEADELEEPYEDYDKDKIADILGAIQIWGDDGALDDVQNILNYELAGKNRKKIVELCQTFLEDPESDEDDDEDAESEVEDEDETEGDEEEESDEVEGEELEEPYEGYDDSSVKEIKEGLTAFVEEDEDDDAQGLVDTLTAVIEYEEAAEKPRVSVVKHAQKLIDSLVDDGEEEEQEAEDEGEEEPEEPAAAPAAKSGRKGGRKGSAGNSEVSEYSANVGTEGLGAGEDAEYDGLIDFVLEELDSENLHVPAEITKEVIELPFDLSETSEAELASLHSAFGSYRYRTSFLLTKHETIQVKSRQAAEEIIDAIFADSDESVSAGRAKAIAEQNPEVKKWRLRQRHHGALAEAMRRRRDDYEAVCALLSRQITARDDQFRHSGGASTEAAPTKPKPGAKKAGSPMTRRAAK